MTKINVSEDDLQKLSECINNQTEIPEDLLVKLSPGFFEKLQREGQFDYQKLNKIKIPTIEYAGKRPESVILAQAAITGGAAPLQTVRSFGKTKDNEWRNMIVQGDNLQFLKTCYLNQDPLIKDKVKGKVKLIYIDPPFGTGDEYGGKNGEMSYSAKLMGAEFIETLRGRLIYLRELLCNDGNIFIRQGHNFGHYIKVILDEIFSKENFAGEIVLKRINAQGAVLKKYNPATESLYHYKKNKESMFKPLLRPRQKEPIWFPLNSPKENPKKNFIFINGEKYISPKGQHWMFSQEKTNYYF